MQEPCTPPKSSMEEEGERKEDEEHIKHASPPPPPNPSQDAGILRLSPAGQPETPTASQDLDIFNISSITALKLLCAGVECLVRTTGDIPPTPPLEAADPIGWRHMRGMQAEKENIVRSTSQTNLASMNALTVLSPKHPNQPSKGSPKTTTSSAAAHPTEPDGVCLRKSSNNNKKPPTETSSTPLEPYLVIGANAEPLNIQHSAITRKFYCRQPPAISLEDYLMRIHSFCPMSCAVYLATSYYIHKLAVEERAIPVTRRNSHRLLLAGLRVAMKATEDLSYPHSRFARVGGVSARELVLLEISFCFLTNFELIVGPEGLQRHAVVLRDLSVRQGAVGWVPKLPGKSLKRAVGGVKEVVTNA